MTGPDQDILVLIAIALCVGGLVAGLAGLALVGSVRPGDQRCAHCQAPANLLCSRPGLWLGHRLCATCLVALHPEPAPSTDATRRGA